MTSKVDKIVSIHTIGCRLNQYESERMATDLYPYGFERAEKGQAADLYIINTCTVTHRADKDCRALIRKVARQNPQASIVVAGCYVDNDPELIEGMESVDVIIRNSEKGSVSSILSEKLPELFDREPDKGCADAIAGFHDHNRAWLKISDGCNQRCSFCILPTVRGPLQNRAPLEIVAEINGLVSLGYSEVVLTGVNIGHYRIRGTEPALKNLANLCNFIIAETDLKRMRISSIEPQTVREELLEVYASSNGRICRHWHIPMQSGSSRILRIMRRPYDRDVYLKRIEGAKAAVPGTVIGADIIVGFPGETDEDFEQSRQMAECGLIDYLHIFSYSDRPGTPASRSDGKINPELIKERHAVLSRTSRRLREETLQRQVGETLEVISEHRASVGGVLYGISDNYIKVKLPSTQSEGKQIIRVKVTSAATDHVVGEVIA